MKETNSENWKTNLTEYKIYREKVLTLTIRIIPQG